MYVVGVDCGGTSTKCLLAQGLGQVIGQGRGGPANYALEGCPAVVNTVAGAIDEALGQAGLTWEEMLTEGAVMVAGVAGTSIPGSIDNLTQGFKELGFKSVSVHMDAHIALAGALSGADGAIVISGTGSIALGKNNKEYARVGGWGYILGDEGSSFWITKEALAYLVRSLDGIVPRDEALEHAALEHFQKQSIFELLQVVYQTPVNRGYLGSFTPVVVRLAEEGNQTCRTLLDNAGQQLGLLAAAVVERLGMIEEPCRVGACGGVFAAGKVILNPMQKVLSQRAPLASVSLPDFPPVVGALIMGYETLGITPAEVVPGLEQWVERGN